MSFLSWCIETHLNFCVVQESNLEESET